MVIFEVRRQLITKLFYLCSLIFCMKDFQLYTLANGIRVVHKEVTSTQIVHCGFILDIGSRDELPEEQGITHFWEHMAFKGTKKRKAFHIINKLESVGGELNAYTTKEKITFYASILSGHFEKALELLTDITFESTFPENQIERERKVILEEMAMYEDDPEDAIQDDFDQVLFGKHPLGHNILGTKNTVGRFSQMDFVDFLKDKVDTNKIVFSVVGNVAFHKVKKLADKYIGHLASKSSQSKRFSFNPPYPITFRKEKNISQAHCVMGRTAFSLNNDKRIYFFLLNNLLGGPALNSRLNLALREKHGYVYAVESSYLPFTDTGLFSISFATEPRHLMKSINLVKRELRKLMDKPLGVNQMHSAKMQLMGQLAMAEENNSGLMLMMGKSLLDLNKIDSLETIFKAIEKITPSDLLEVANEILDSNYFSYLTYTPE